MACTYCKIGRHDWGFDLFKELDIIRLNRTVLRELLQTMKLMSTQLHWRRPSLPQHKKNWSIRWNLPLIRRGAEINRPGNNCIYTFLNVRQNDLFTSPAFLELFVWTSIMTLPTFPVRSRPLLTDQLPRQAVCISNKCMALLGKSLWVF